MGSGSSPLSCGVFFPLPLLQAFPFLVAGHVLLLLPSPADLFFYSSRRDSSPCLFGAQGAPPSLLHVFLLLLLLLLLIIQFFFFPWVGIGCPGGYADLAQGCLWVYRVPLSSPCGPRLPKPSGSWHLAAAREPCCFLPLM
jgi:hypothetical protein